MAAKGFEMARNLAKTIRETENVANEAFVRVRGDGDALGGFRVQWTGSGFRA